MRFSHSFRSAWVRSPARLSSPAPRGRANRLDELIVSLRWAIAALCKSAFNRGIRRTFLPKGLFLKCRILSVLIDHLYIAHTNTYEARGYDVVFEVRRV